MSTSTAAAPRPRIDIVELNGAIAAAAGFERHLEAILEPHIADWARRLRALHEGRHGNWFTAPYPHERVHYRLDIRGSETGTVHFTGADPDGDPHDFDFPLRFINDADGWEAEARSEMPADAPGPCRPPGRKCLGPHPISIP